jgi:hypothetical protein
VLSSGAAAGKSSSSPEDSDTEPTDEH